MGKKMHYRYFSEENEPYDNLYNDPPMGSHWDTAHPRWYETIEQFEASRGGTLYGWNAGKCRKQPSTRLIDSVTSTVVQFRWHKSLSKKAKALLMASPVTQRVPE